MLKQDRGRANLNNSKSDIALQEQPCYRFRISKKWNLNHLSDGL